MNLRDPDPLARAAGRRRLALLGLVVFALAAFAVALVAGSMAIGPLQAWSALWGGGEDMATRVVLELRLPRALAAFTTGGLLALAGALMQVLLRNPLADPYVLGVSGGAGVAALGAMLLGLGGLVLTGGDARWLEPRVPLSCRCFDNLVLDGLQVIAEQF